MGKPRYIWDWKYGYWRKVRDTPWPARGYVWMPDLRIWWPVEIR